MRYYRLQIKFDPLQQARCASEFCSAAIPEIPALNLYLAATRMLEFRYRIQRKESREDRMNL